jgi:hypothetical protein
MLRVTVIASCLLAALGAVGPPDARATGQAAPTSTPTPSTPSQTDAFSTEEIAQLIAPVALYPDALLAQVLMASTYPGDVADAAAWAKKNPEAKGEAAVKAVENETWDPSVQSLVAFPQVVLMLGQDTAWVQKLGDAFLAQPDDVMKVAQDLRRKAQAAGNLETNQYQRVASGPAEGGSQTIIIESTQPDTIYVPAYDPTYVYGGWAYAGYPPYYYPPSAYWYPGGALVRGFMWGAGMAIAGNLWGNVNWGGGDININRNTNINRSVDRGDRTVNRGEGGRWEHNAANRDGVPYRDQGSREKYGNRQPGADQRGQYRGEDAQRTQSREQARQSMERQGMQPARDNQQARDRAQTASRDPRSSQAGGGRADRGPGGTTSPSYRQSGASNSAARSSAHSGGSGSRNNAFSGASNPGASRSASSRGSSSRASSGRSASPSRSMSRPPSRGGGGGRRR